MRLFEFTGLIFQHTVSHLPNCKVFFTSLRWCCAEEPVYFMHMIFPHPAYEAGCVDSKSSVCIVIGWVGGRNVLMHKYIRHWNYNLMVCGIREGSSCSLHSLSFFSLAAPPFPFLCSVTCFHLLPILCLFYFSQCTKLTLSFNFCSHFVVVQYFKDILWHDCVQYIMQFRNGLLYQVNLISWQPNSVVRSEHRGSAFLKVMP